MRTTLAVLLAVVPTLLVGTVAGHPVSADGPGVGAPWIVSLGDSYISGEASRWAGNSNSSATSVDAGGATAYFDNGGVSETIRGCHRSTAAEIHIGRAANASAVASLNLACSGARTSTSVSSDGSYRPGIDFYNSSGRLGQALPARHVERLVGQHVAAGCGQHVERRAQPAAHLDVGGVVAGAEVGVDQRRRRAEPARGARDRLVGVAEEQPVVGRDAVGMGRHLALEDVDVAPGEEVAQVVVGAAVAQADLEDREIGRAHV